MIHISKLVHRYTVYGTKDGEKKEKTVLNSISMDIVQGNLLLYLDITVRANPHWQSI